MLISLKQGITGKEWPYMYRGNIIILDMKIDKQNLQDSFPLLSIFSLLNKFLILLSFIPFFTILEIPSTFIHGATWSLVRLHHLVSDMSQVGWQAVMGVMEFYLCYLVFQFLLFYILSINGWRTVGTDSCLLIYIYTCNELLRNTIFINHYTHHNILAFENILPYTRYCCAGTDC